MAAQPQAFIDNQALVIRRATPADAEVCDATYVRQGSSRWAWLKMVGLLG